MTHRPNAITHTQEYTVLPGVVRHIIFSLFTTPNLCPPLTQNPSDTTERKGGEGKGWEAGGVGEVTSVTRIASASRPDIGINGSTPLKGQKKKRTKFVY